MKDLAIQLDNRPGAIAEMGEALAKAGVSVDGGGAWVADSIVGLPIFFLKMVLQLAKRLKLLALTLLKNERS